MCIFIWLDSMSDEDDEHIRWMHEFFKPTEYKEPPESVFLDRRKILRYDPDELLFQYENLQLMKNIFEVTFESPPKNKQLVISGPSESGKSTLASYFCKWLEKKGAEIGIKIKPIYVNPYYGQNLYKMAIDIMDQLKISTAVPRKYKPEIEFEIIHDFLDINKIHVIFIFNQIEGYFRNFVNANADKVHHIVESMGSLITESSVIILTREDKIVRQARKRFPDLSQIELAPLTKQQVSIILNERIKMAFKTGTISNKLISYIIDLIFSDAKDLERQRISTGLKILKESGDYADEREGDREVSFEDVEKAKIVFIRPI